MVVEQVGILACGWKDGCGEGERVLASGRKDGCGASALIKKKTKFSLYIRNPKGSGCKALYDLRPSHI